MPISLDEQAPLGRQDMQPVSGFRPSLLHLEELVSHLAIPRYLFRLYVSGPSLRSRRAITNVRRICDQYLAGQYELEVIDIYQQPMKTKEAQVIAIPTLIKETPLPHKRLIGDMSNTERVLIGLDLRRR